MLSFRKLFVVAEATIDGDKFCEEIGLSIHFLIEDEPVLFASCRLVPNVHEGVLLKKGKALCGKSAAGAPLTLDAFLHLVVEDSLSLRLLSCHAPQDEEQEEQEITVTKTGDNHKDKRIREIKWPVFR